MVNNNKVGKFVSIFGIMSMVLSNVDAVFQLNVYYDNNCQNYIVSRQYSGIGSCQSSSVGINSYIIVGQTDFCEWGTSHSTFVLSSYGDCAGEGQVGGGCASNGYECYPTSGTAWSYGDSKTD